MVSFPPGAGHREQDQLRLCRCLVHTVLGLPGTVERHRWHERVRRVGDVGGVQCQTARAPQSGTGVPSVDAISQSLRIPFSLDG